MKQKYIILRDDKEKKLIIREHAELDKDVMSPLYEEVFEEKVIKRAIKEGKNKVISELCTNNMYPLGEYARKIADSVIELYETKDKPSAELFFDDKEMLIKEDDDVDRDEALSDPEELDDDTERESKSDEVDELLEDKDDAKK